VERRPTSTAAIAAALEVKVPSIGDYTDVPIIDVLVRAGDEVAADAPLVTLESDKATMDVPSPAAGKIRELKVKTGDRVSEGSVIAILESAAPATRSDLAASALEPVEGRDHLPDRPEPAAPSAAPPPAAPALRAVPSPAPEEPRPAGRVAHASPSVRKLARELGVDLSRVEGTGPKGRVLQPDVQRYVKDALARAAAAPAGAGAGLELAPWPRVDFAKFGPVDVQPLSRIRKLSKTNLARNWVMIPHVTQHDEADITDLEKFRKELNEEHAKQGPKVTLLAFLVKAAVSALREFPELNASLDGDQLVLKHYFHVGFAADTPNGLVVPVIHDADLKGVLEIAKELAALAAKARDGKLALADMQGGCFSISSLGGIGGTFFTPIINAPEVAILGVSRSAMKPVWDGEKFVPRLILPLSLSYDHRVIDGALAARITTYLVRLLGDFRRAML
jgi:pyruvate dehydrogenase E2 component (dihydrolipoamide acetyltransferase)